MPTDDPLSFRPVILIGAARSGTNMLRDALLTVPGVATWPCDEINYLWRHYHASWPTDEFGAELATPRVRRFLRTRFARQARTAGAAWLVEKTCANSLRVDFVRAVFPEAKFLWLVRDGRDVVASALKRWKAPLDVGYIARKARFVPPGDVPYYAFRYIKQRLYRHVSRERRLGSWGPRFEGIDQWLATRSLAEVCAEQWRRSVLAAGRSLAHLSANQVCHLRYETFVEQPAIELARTWEFLGISPTSSHLEQAASQISRQSVGKWRRESTAAQVQAVEPMIEQTLQELETIALESRHAPPRREVA